MVLMVFMMIPHVCHVSNFSFSILRLLYCTSIDRLDIGRVNHGERSAATFWEIAIADLADVANVVTYG